MRSLAAATFISLALASSAAAATVEATDLEGVMQTPYTIECADSWTYPEALGYAFIADGIVLMQQWACDRLRGPLAIDSGYASALEGLLHELAHVGWRNPNESAAECFALFTFRWEARHRFGATVTQANALFRLAWFSHVLLPQPYQGCPEFRVDPLPG